MDLILASTSRYRREQLERLGVPFRAIAPACDEEELKRTLLHPGMSPRQLAEHLAIAKAASLRPAHPQAVIIGGDQVATVDERILGKPGTTEAAHAQLERLAGRTHALVTAIAVSSPGRDWRHTDVTLLTMRALTDAQIARYIAHDQPLDCAGAYKLERRGVALFTRIQSEDHSAITGLPLIALTAILARCGYVIP